MELFLYTILNVNSVNDNALSEVQLHGASDLVSRLLRHKNAHEIQGRVKASSHSSARDDAKTAEAHGCATGDRLATRVGSLEGDGTLSVRIY